MKTLKSYRGVSQSYLFDSEIPWPTTAIFGGIHGDEISGVLACFELVRQFEERKLRLLRWKLIIVIVWNEEAHSQNKRYILKNLNRLFRSDNRGDDYESRRAKELMGILNECDYFLDLHSTSGPSVPFLFSDRKGLSLGSQIWIGTLVVWWNELVSLSVSWDTESYVNNRGGQGFTFEAGNHLAPDAQENSLQIATNFLARLGHIDEVCFSESRSAWAGVIEMKSVYVCKSNDFRFAIDAPSNFMKIKKGQAIGTDDDMEIIAENDFILIMPNLAGPKKGEEAYFIGRILELHKELPAWRSHIVGVQKHRTFDMPYNGPLAEEWTDWVESPNPEWTREREIFPFIRTWLKEHNPRSLLDIGCGQGSCSEWVDEKIEYTGMDPSNALIERARRLYSRTTKRFIVWDAYKIPLWTESTDAVMSVWVWSHLGDLARAAKEMERILKKWGRFLIITANPETYEERKTFYKNFTIKGNLLVGDFDLGDGKVLTKTTLYLHDMGQIEEAIGQSGLTIDSIKRMGQENSDHKGLYIVFEGSRQ